MRALWDEEKWILFEGIFSQELALLKVNVMDKSGTVISAQDPPGLSAAERVSAYLPAGPVQSAARAGLPCSVQVGMEDFVTEGLEGFAEVLISNPEQLTISGG